MFQVGFDNPYGLTTGIINLNSGGLLQTNLPFTGAGFTGYFNFSGGTLQATAFSANFLPGAKYAYVNDGGAVINDGGNAITITNNLLQGGPLGSGGLTKLGGGTLTLTGSSTYTGGTTINSGMLSFANGALGSSGTVEFVGNSTLQWYGGNTQDISSRLKIDDGVTATFDTNSNNVTFGNTLLVGAAASGSLTKVGAGMLTLAASNSYTGGTTVSGGTLQVGNLAALGSGGLVANAGVLDLNSYPISVPTLNGAAGTITDNSAAGSTRLTVTNSGNFAGTLSDGASTSVALAMTGPGGADRLGQQHLQRRNQHQQRHGPGG